MIASHFSCSTNCEVFEPLWDRQKEWNYRLNIIRNAKKFVYISTFYIDIKKYGEIFIDELINAQIRNVKVILIIDSFGQKLGSRLMNRAEIVYLDQKLQSLRDAGSKIVYYTPQTALQRLLGSGHHVKIQLNDSGEALFGSSNISIRSFEQWNEFSCYLKGKIILPLFDTLEYLLQDQIQSYEINNDRNILAHLLQNEYKSNYSLEYHFCDPNHLQSKLHPLFDISSNSITDRLTEMIHNAKQNIQISSFYFKPFPKLLDHLCRIAQNGVKISIFHSHRKALPETSLAWIASFQNYSRLLKNKIVIYENLKGEHSKLLLIDNAVAGFGSYNFEYAAHDRLIETFMFSKDVRIINCIENIFQNLQHDSNNQQVYHSDTQKIDPMLRIKSFFPLLKKWA